MSVPRQIKHCTMEVFNKLKNVAPINENLELAKFVNAWNICTAKAQQYGYVYIISGVAKEDSVHLTQKGIIREEEHNKDTSIRAAMFDQYWDKYSTFI